MKMFDNFFNITRYSTTWRNVIVYNASSRCACCAESFQWVVDDEELEDVATEGVVQPSYSAFPAMGQVT